ncbi:YciI family protein [Micromonospora vulcania]|uniref:YciI family protein n=1 Tax=Micromonospora vulcania TaxID=1441873 RepID=A0ABW1HAW0_9ACTN
MAKYLILIYGDERQWAAMSPQELRQRDEAHHAFSVAAGPAILDGQQLELANVATALRADPTGRLAITDGPFLETKEAVGGYYLIEAADLDEVIALTSGLYEVSAGHSGVEIRPVVEHG